MITIKSTKEDVAAVFWNEYVVFSASPNKQKAIGVKRADGGCSYIYTDGTVDHRDLSFHSIDLPEMDSIAQSIFNDAPAIMQAFEESYKQAATAHQRFLNSMSPQDREQWLAENEDIA